MGKLIFLVIVGSAAWVGYDAHANKVSINAKKPYSLNTGTLAWVLTCLILWPVTFPYYLVRRTQTLSGSSLKKTTEQSELEGASTLARQKVPSLLWRRLTAAIVDLLLLKTLDFTAVAVIGSALYGRLLAWFVFFIIWYLLVLKRSITPGKALMGIVTNLNDASAEKSPRLLLRFAVTWMPLFFLSLPAFEFALDGQPFLVTMFQIVFAFWYVALLVGITATQGKCGIQDSICKSESTLRVNELLSPRRKVVAWICVALLVVVYIMSVFPWNEEQPPVGTVIVTREGGRGLSLESLNLTAHTVEGYWKELDALFDDEYCFSGSAAVITKEEEKLYLVSNRHVLSLDVLAQSDDSSDMKPEVNQYVLYVTFASGKKVRVDRFAHHVGFIDLAILEVSGVGLVEGRDYVIVPYDSSLLLNVGEDTVAVGSPHGLKGTHTFGKISAVRNWNFGEPFKAIQTDAAINPGNSGGPLFVKKGEAYIWAGINTYNMHSDNLGFAVHASHVWGSKYYWFPVSARGAADAIIQLYGRDAVVK